MRRCDISQVEHGERAPASVRKASIQYRMAACAPERGRIPVIWYWMGAWRRRDSRSRAVPYRAVPYGRTWPVPRISYL